MARKTKEQLAAERQAWEAANQALARDKYPSRLMAALERLSNLGGTIFVRDGFFNVKTSYDTYDLAYHYEAVYDDALYELEYDLNREEARVAEAERKAALYKTALNKLTKEEREILGVKG